jgi:hypothetical protein
LATAAIDAATRPVYTLAAIEDHIEIKGRLAPSQRSLLAEVEGLAHWYESPIAVSEVRHSGRSLATSFTFARRLATLDTGIHDGVLLLEPEGARPGALATILAEISETANFDLATLRIAGPRPLDFPPGPVRRHGRYHFATTSEVAQEVLPLAPDYSTFLAGLGRSTRRNVEQCRRSAERNHFAFAWLAQADIDRNEIKMLCWNNIPRAVPPRKFASFLHYSNTQPRPFCGTLRDDAGRLVSLAGGFIEGELALMMFQLNSGVYRAVGPSLMMRSFIVERLIGENVRHLAFVGRCGGLLLHACERVAVSAALLVRDTPLSRLKHKSCVLAEPQSRIAQLSIALNNGHVERGARPDGF